MLQLLASLEGHVGNVTGIAVTPDGRKAISVSWDKTVRIWDIENFRNLNFGTQIKRLIGNRNILKAVAITTDGSKVISSDNHNLKFWDVESGIQSQIIRFGHNIVCFAVTTDGSRVVIGGSDSGITIWDCKNNKSLKVIKGYPLHITAIAITPDGTRIVSGSEDGTLKIWSMDTGGNILTIVAHSQTVSAIVIAPGGSKFISSSFDKTVKIWNINTGDPLGKFIAPFSYVNSVTVTPDGLTLIFGCVSVIKVWNIDQQKEVQTLRGHDDIVQAITVTPDGSMLLSTSRDKTVKIWAIKRNLQWNITNHTKFPSQMKKCIKTIFIQSQKTQHSKSIFRDTPKDVIFYIFSFLYEDCIVPI